MDTIYSHAFFVGSFNGNVTPAQLESAGWKRGEIPGIYDNVYSTYYKGHVDAILELDADKPDFLKGVCHYRLPFEKRAIDGTLIDPGKRFTIKLGREDNSYDYTFTLSNLHIYFFPYEIVLLAIEIDDSGTELNALTKAHGGFGDKQFAVERNKEFMEVFQSIVPFVKGNSVDNILADGNKFKIFQILQIDTDTIEDTLLYEVGTLSPVGCIGSDNWLAPSYEYYHDNIIHNNKVSLFDSWRGFALVDSFTMISKEKTNPYGTSDGQFFLWRNFYFPLIYLRCIIEKTFCFRRNTAYRRNHNAENLVEEIADMERYYFYNNISYNFMPNLLYDSMAFGLGLQEERMELSNQVKERAKEERAQQKELNEKRTNLLTVLLSIFAIFSVVWDLCSIFTSAIPSWNKQSAAITFITIGFLAFTGVMHWYFRRKKTTVRKPLINKPSLPAIIIGDDARHHVSTHFDKTSPGSKFHFPSPDAVLKQAMKLFPAKFTDAVADPDGRFRISLNFLYVIGTSNIIAVSDLTPEQRAQIKTVDRHGRKVRAVNGVACSPTSECQMVFSPDWKLITMFPGMMAPPLPASPDEPDEFWDNHVFIASDSSFACET